MKRRLAVLTLFIGVLVFAGCKTTSQPAPSLLTPLEPAQIADVELLDPVDAAALEVFFARWGAYMAALGTAAEDEEEVYGELYAYSTSWRQAVTEDPVDGGVQVLLYLPASPGLLRVAAADGHVLEASTSYDSESDDIRASMAFTVAGNGVIYSLSSNDDMNAVAAIYNDCVTALNKSGAGMSGAISHDGYAFSLSLIPDDSTMSFAAVREPV